MLERKDIDVLKDIWRSDNKRLMLCPICDGSLNVNAVARTSQGTLKVSYDTFIECENCSFNLKVNSFKILGTIKRFDEKAIDISSWSPIGDREITSFGNSLDEDTLKEVFSSEELAEFLVVDGRVVAVL